MFANNEIGTIQPIKELCDTAHVHGEDLIYRLLFIAPQGILQSGW